jgi:ribosome-associated translation inhibitor RaiA
MRLDIEGKHMTLAPHLMGWIAERLEDLNTPYDDIYEARVIFVQQGRREAVCIELLLAEQSLHVTQRGATPDAAVEAAFRVVQQELHGVGAVGSNPRRRYAGDLAGSCAKRCWEGRTLRISGLGWADTASTHHLCEGKHVWRRNVRFM